MLIHLRNDVRNFYLFFISRFFLQFFDFSSIFRFFTDLYAIFIVFFSIFDFISIFMRFFDFYAIFRFFLFFPTFLDFLLSTFLFFRLFRFFFLIFRFFSDFSIFFPIFRFFPGFFSRFFTNAYEIFRVNYHSYKIAWEGVNYAFLSFSQREELEIDVTFFSMLIKFSFGTYVRKKKTLEKSYTYAAKVIDKLLTLPYYMELTPPILLRPF